MSFQTCAIKAKKWYQENAPEIKMPDREIEAAARWLEANGGDKANPAQFAKRMQDALDEYTTRVAAKERAEKATDAVKRARGLKTSIETMRMFVESGMDKGAAAVEARLNRIEGGSPREGVEVSISPLRMAQSLESSFLQFFHDALRGNLLYLQRLPISDPASLDIYRAKGLIESGGDLNAVKNEQAIEIAHALTATQNRSFSEKQAVSPFLERAKNYIAERNHNQERIIQATNTPEGRDRWLMKVMKNYGETSLIGLTPAEKLGVYEEVLDKIRAGTWGGDKSYDFFSVKGAAGSMAERMARGRVFVASSPEAEWDYAKDYGDSLYKAMVGNLRSSANQVAQITKWGSNAQDNFVAEQNAFRRTLDPEARAYFDSKKDDMLAAFRISMGSQNAAADNMWAKGFQASKVVQFLSKAGMHIPRSLHDFQNVVTMTRDTFGGNLVENSFGAARGIGKALLKYGDSKEFLADMGVFTRGTSAEITSAIANLEDKPGSGKIAQTAKMLGKLNLGEIQQTAIKTSMARMLGKHLGGLTDTPYAKLLPETQAGLMRYGLHDVWDLVRQGKETAPFYEGRTRDMLSPEAVRNLPNEVLEQHMRDTGKWSQEKSPPQRLIDQTKFEAAAKLGTMFNDMASMSAANPDLRQLRWMFGDTTQNNGKGLFWRAIFEFKQAAVTNFDVMRRSYFNGRGSKASMSGFAQHLLMGATYAMIGEAFSQMLAGRDPDNLDTSAVIKHGILGSQFGSIWADGLVNATRNTSRQDTIGSAAESLVGPSLSTAGEAALAAVRTGKGLYDKYVNDDEKADLQGRWWTHLANSNIPAQNVFYLKAGMNYFLVNELQHMLGNEGYLEALRKQADKSDGGFWMEPGSHF